MGNPHSENKKREVLLDSLLNSSI